MTPKTHSPPPPTRNVCITSADGQTGHLIAELLLIEPSFTSKLKSITLLALDPSKCSDLESLEDSALKPTIVQYIPGDLDALVDALRSSGADTIMLIPPSHTEKFKLTKEMIKATETVGIPNTVLLSSAGADLAERETQPRLREFIDIEALFMMPKGLTDTETGHSACIIRAGFYAENLLLYNKASQSSGKLPIPIGTQHKFAPVALGDIAQVATHILTGHGTHGLNDKHRGQLIVITGPMLTSGDELASAASDALSIKLQFEDISPDEAKSLLDADTDISDAEKEYLLEYYSLVREGKTNYISTLAFNAITGGHPMEPPEFFKSYEGEFKPKRRRMHKE